ncbi:hypothetical protein E4U55_004635 [Claviceps digitariae]|nr:hypothetical protein E4U55_004635 [Claviceps digitariae]
MKDLPLAHRSIVNVASIATFFHVPDVYAYATFKSITNTPMLQQFGPKAQSLVETPKPNGDQGLPTSEADDVARTIVWFLSDDSRPVYGANINVGACPP